MGMQETDSPAGGEQNEPRAGLRFFALIAVAAAGLAVLWMLRRPHAPRAAGHDGGRTDRAARR